MRDEEHVASVYTQLAWLSHQKRQALARDRFLLLAGAAACRAGWLEVAERCRALLVGFAPQHQLASYASLPDALRDSEFQPLVRAVERHCPFERAEHLLAGSGETPLPPQAQPSAALELLQRPEWGV